MKQAWIRIDNDLLNHIYRRGFDIVLYHGSETLRNALRPLHEAIQKRQIPFVRGKSEYEQGMDPDTRQQLEKYFIDDVSQLAHDQGRDLTHWFDYHKSGVSQS